MSAAISISKPSVLGAFRNIGKGLYNLTAKLAGYNAASPTATTRVGGRIGTNTNSTWASLQRVGMQFTAEMVAKNSAIGAAYLSQRINYCSSLITYIPATGDTGLDAEITNYLHDSDGCGGAFSTMGVDCSMQDAFSRTADIETPVRGDAGLIWWRDDSGDLRLLEFSADQLGEIYNYQPPRSCSIGRNAKGDVCEVAGNDCIYFAGRYFRGADAVAYKIFERNNSWYGNPQIYAASDVLFFRDPASFRGIRGVTKFANALEHMQKGEDMLQAALASAQRQARTAGRVFNNSGSPAGDYESVNIQGDPALGNMVKYFEREPGGPNVEYFYNGDSAEFVNPTAPGPEIIQGVETADERVAIALGMNYAFLISATKVGGAPSRLEIEKADKELQRIQNTIHRPKLNKIRDVVLMDASNRGLIRRPFGMTKEKFLRGNWMLPISPSVDAFYDAKENISMVRAGLESAQDVIAETNRNWEDVLLKGKQWAMRCSMMRQDGNAELAKTISPITGQPYNADLTAQDIAQTSDNPQQAAAAENIQQGKPAEGQTAPKPAAAMAEWDESKHKRADDGKFGEGGGGAKKEEESKPAPSGKTSIGGHTHKLQPNEIKGEHADMKRTVFNAASSAADEITKARPDLGGYAQRKIGALNPDSPLKSFMQAAEDISALGEHAKNGTDIYGDPVKGAKQTPAPAPAKGGEKPASPNESAAKTGDTKAHDSGNWGDFTKLLTNGTEIQNGTEKPIEGKEGYSTAIAKRPEKPQGRRASPIVSEPVAVLLHGGKIVGAFGGDTVAINPEHRGNGLSKHLYQRREELGPLHSQNFSPAGKAANRHLRRSG